MTYLLGAGELSAMGLAGGGCAQGREAALGPSHVQLSPPEEPRVWEGSFHLSGPIENSSVGAGTSPVGGRLVTSAKLWEEPGGVGRPWKSD